MAATRFSDRGGATSPSRPRLSESRPDPSAGEGAAPVRERALSKPGLRMPTDTTAYGAAPCGFDADFTSRATR